MCRVLDALPEGWRYIEGALTAPTGFRWACNGKSRFSPGYRHALVMEATLVSPDGFCAWGERRGE